MAKKKNTKRWLVDEAGRKYLQQYSEIRNGGPCSIRTVEDLGEREHKRLYIDEGSVRLNSLNPCWSSCEGMARTLLEMVEELTDEEFLAAYKSDYQGAGATYENIIALGQKLQDMQPKVEKKLEEEHIAFCKEHGYYQER